MTMSLGFLIDHQYGLGTGLDQFCLSQHTTVTQKILKGDVDQHQVIAGGCEATTLVDVDSLTPPNDIALLESLSMAQSSHAHRAQC